MLEKNANYLKPWSSNFICMRCGAKRKEEYKKIEWTGLIVCTDCFDPKHPFLMPVPLPPNEMQPIPNSSPRPLAQFIDISTFGFSKWGGPYLSGGQLVNNVNWDQWDMTWGEIDSNLVLR